MLTSSNVAPQGDDTIYECLSEGLSGELLKTSTPLIVALQGLK